jgi:hypothetical protein
MRKQIQIQEVTKRGEWYTVKGGSGSEHASVEIPANTVESRSRGDAEALFRRGLAGEILRQRG